MKMRNILRDRKSWRFPGCSIDSVSGDGPDDQCSLGAVSSGAVNNRSTTDPIYCNPIDKVSGTRLLPSADVASKKAKSGGSDSRISKPSDLHTERQPAVSWDEAYRLLWKVKMSRSNKHNR
jgi:hypothetical protein